MEKSRRQNDIGPGEHPAAGGQPLWDEGAQRPGGEDGGLHVLKMIKTRSGWLNSALRGDEADNWCDLIYWIEWRYVQVSRSPYWRTHSQTLTDRANQLFMFYDIDIFTSNQMYLNPLLVVWSNKNYFFQYSERSPGVLVFNWSISKTLAVDHRCSQDLE